MPSLQDQPTTLAARVAVLEAALQGTIAHCPTCKGRGHIHTWNVSSGAYLVNCPDCAAARAALKADA